MDQSSQESTPASTTSGLRSLPTGVHHMAEMPRLQPGVHDIQRGKRVVPPVKKEGYSPESTTPSQGHIDKAIEIAEAAARAIYQGKAKFGVGLIRRSHDPAMVAAQATLALSFMLSPPQAITQMKRALEGHK